MVRFADDCLLTVCHMAFPRCVHGKGESFIFLWDHSPMGLGPHLKTSCNLKLPPKDPVSRWSQLGVRVLTYTFGGIQFSPHHWPRKEFSNDVIRGLQHLTFFSSKPSRGFSFLAAPGNPLKSSSILSRLPFMTKPCCRACWGGLFSWLVEKAWNSKQASCRIRSHKGLERHGCHWVTERALPESPNLLKSHCSAVKPWSHSPNWVSIMPSAKWGGGSILSKNPPLRLLYLFPGKKTEPESQK